MLVKGTCGSIEVLFVVEVNRLRENEDWPVVIGVYDTFSKELMLLPEVAEIASTAEEDRTIANGFFHLRIRVVVETGCVSHIKISFGAQIVRAGNPDEMIACILVLRIVQERALLESRDNV